MSTPVRGAEGPLGYAPRWARGGGRNAAAFNNRAAPNLLPVQELAPQQDLKPPRIAMPPRDAVSARDVASVRDTNDVASVRDTSSARDTVLPRDTISHRDSKPSEASAAAQDIAAVQDSATESIWRRKKRPQIFEGDTAMRELRARLALAPDQMPEPPLYQAKDSILGVVARLMGVMVLAAVGALGFLWITAPHSAPPDGQVAGQPDGQAALVSYRSVEALQPPPAAQNVRTERAPEAPSSGGPWTVANYSRDVTDGIGTPPAALAPRTLAPAVPRSPASRVSTPPPAAPAPPPPAAVPASRSPPSAVAAPVPALAPPPSTVAAPDRDEVAALLTRARAYLSAGDVAAARLVLRRAAEREDPQAALALGGTYDPVMLKRLGIINFHSDPAQAREWYRRAAELGSADASLRLEQLVQTDR